jgi:hypothetical protein
MWRGVPAIFIIYGWGHPSLESVRPGWLDRPLQAFHQDVNTAAREGQTAIANFDSAQHLRFLQDFVVSIQSKVRGGR